MNEFFRNATISNMKKYITKFKKELDLVEKDLNSDDELKNICACYHTLALATCAENISETIDELIKKSKELGVITKKDE